ncbi:hypothetical protein DFH07DRAFT_490940 [Mycena maculata]|uniref:BZIP domain-containing protein n=1 Tax=Mycena maculata TaxID=230809 RepID=A0AAD7J1X4_9AGAR|nr:hypothetical protein DFH07DRAFT_490940 [Mycena maculata]
MTRGRKKDHTIPASRALTLQRDYRARKSHYIADLEARCQAAEEENVRLRKELELARQGVPPAALTPEAIQASAQLRDKLAAAATSLSHFMQVAMPPDQGTTPPSYTALLSSLATAASVQYPTDRAAANYRTDLEKPRPESPCCGGYINCEGLVEEEDEDVYPEQEEGHQISPSISQLRSTSSGAAKGFE